MNFLYKAIDSRTGKEVKGKLHASSEEVAIRELKGKGLFIAELNEQVETIWNKDLNITLGKPVKNQDFVVFCRQLATLLKAGTTITEAINILSDQVTSKRFKEVLNDVYFHIRSGTPFSEACEKHPKVFDKVFINMVRAGETSGDLENVLERLATFYEKERRVREKVKSAMMYPIAVSIIAIGVVITLLTVVLPNLLANLTSMGGDIPLPTQLVMGASDFLIQRWYIVMLLVTVLILAFISIKRNQTGKYMLDYAKLKIPIFGLLAQKTILARVTRTMASLFSSSVPVLQTLTMSAEISDNEVVKKVLHDSKESLRAGESLSGPLSESWVFPKLVSHMVKVGEESGQLDTMLEKVADFYEEEVEQMASRLSAIMEPLMIVVLGLIVGTIVLAAILPMFSIYDNFGG
ncbi:type II secretion system F family protein [Halalkalibacter krulwichiae]|uniref:Putative type II secretion system protein F n=1 Tax=Halalkalibacter krulwichiae TaxID=199441 RepID=A0A1X9MDV6_9BACI|nr:type II secretion system F family protein [Halalkalibacter krulwichiae]ARK31596.1 Putative type II secretion system protein F [Halalkalibacter krulwichiae]